MAVTWWPPVETHEYDDQFSCVAPGVDGQGRIYLMTWESWHDSGENGVIIAVMRCNDRNGYDSVQHVSVHDEFDEWEEWEDLLKIGEEVERAIMADPEGFDLEAYKVERVL